MRVGFNRSGHFRTVISLNVIWSRKKVRAVVTGNRQGPGQLNRSSHLYHGVSVPSPTRVSFLTTPDSSVGLSIDDV